MARFWYQGAAGVASVDVRACPHGACSRMLQDGAPPLSKAEAIRNIDGASVVTYLRRGENAVQQQKEGETEREV